MGKDKEIIKPSILKAQPKKKKKKVCDEIKKVGTSVCEVHRKRG